MPHSLPSTIELTCPVEFETADVVQAEGGAEPVKVKTFAGVAYTGAEMKPNGFYGSRVIVDLEGMQVQDTMPVFRSHDSDRIVGHTTAVANTGKAVKVQGKMSGVGNDVDEITALSANGFPWQMSVGATVDRTEFVEAGTTVVVNKNKFAGPGYVVRQSRLYEVSFVALGADGATTAKVTAFRSDNSMTPEEIEAARKKAQQDQRDAAAEEEDRQAGIRRVCAQHGDPLHNATENRTLAAHAIKEGWTVERAQERAELLAMRANRPHVNTGTGGARDGDRINADVMTCALMQAGSFGAIEAAFPAPVLEAAHKQYRGRASLQEIILQCARVNGYHGSHRFAGNERAILQAAFSSIDISGILANTANKFLMEGFNSVDQAYQRLAAKRTVTDFKTVTSYRLTAGAELEEVAPDGVIPHGKLGEDSYTNQAKTYAKMFAVTYQDMRNDDIGAISSVPRKLGRGGILALNKRFWTAYLATLSTFYTTARGNVISGGTSALAAQGLGLAYAAYLALKDGDDEQSPLGVMPKYLVVGPSLAVAAMQLNQSLQFGAGGAATTAQIPLANVFAGKFEPVISPYLENTSITGAATGQWFLQADPNDEPLIEIAYLDGVEYPTVETAEADFNTLGIQMRGVFHFGVSRQSYRGAIRAVGQ